MAGCSHLDHVQLRELPDEVAGCEDCLAAGDPWFHLRICLECGHVGCCDDSPNKHATAHWRSHADHPVIRSFEPGEDWWWCYPDRLVFDVPGADPAPSYR